MIILALTVFWRRPAVAHVNVNILVLDAEALKLLLLDVLATIARAKEKPDLTLGTAFYNRVGHTQHRRDADAARDQHNGSWLCQIEEKSSGRSFGVEDVAFFDAIAKKARSGARWQVRFVRRRRFLLDRDAIIIWMIRAVGKRIATDERFVTTRNIQ